MVEGDGVGFDPIEGESNVAVGEEGADPVA